MTLTHEDNNVREFYSKLPRPVRVRIEGYWIDGVVREPSVGAGRAAFGQSSGRRDKWSHGLGDLTLQAGAFDYDTFMTLAGLCKPTSKIKTD
jgi:hypothetical protein